MGQNNPCTNGILTPVRHSTRPFLAPVEKKWIAYQILTALRDAREKDVGPHCHVDCEVRLLNPWLQIAHGDLKSENILITPSLSVLVTDFASSFKKTYLQLTDPADFNFFYDSSGRRTCYIAPERFYADDSDIAKEKHMAESMSGTDLGGSRLLSNAGIGKRDGRVTEEMDVFSAGCVLLEMWTDGNGVFDLGELYAYRAGNASGVQALLDGLAEPAVKVRFGGSKRECQGAQCSLAADPPGVHDRSRSRRPPVVRPAALRLPRQGISRALLRLHARLHCHCAFCDCKRRA